MTAAIILEPSLLVLIARQLEDVAPTGLIPRRTDQSPAPQRIADRQGLSIRREQPLRIRSERPHPARPEYRNQERLHVPGRDVDDRVARMRWIAGMQLRIGQCGE